MAIALIRRIAYAVTAANAVPSKEPDEIDVTVEDIDTLSTSHNVSGGGIAYMGGKVGMYSGPASTVSENKRYVYLRHSNGMLTQNIVDDNTYAALSRLKNSKAHVFWFGSGYRWNGNWLDTVNIVEHGVPDIPEDEEVVCE